MKYRMKADQPVIEVVDGPMAGRRFIPGQEYDDIPESEAARFERVDAAEADLPKDEKEGWVS